MRATTSKIGVQILEALLEKAGVRDLVFSPGSRNAPLVIGLVGSGKFNAVCIHDERSAAFFAMGKALVSGRPVPVLCTSGSALLNYSPAVAEAYYQRIPFLVISADRPLEWIDRGDGQTIRQAGVYSNFIDYQISFPSEATDEHTILEYQIEIQKALNFAKVGSVHINMPFEEPLYELTEATEWQPSSPRIEDLSSLDLKSLEFDELSRVWSSHEKRMILVGQMSPQTALGSFLDTLSADGKTVILSENTSNFYAERAIPCIDRVLATFDENDESFQPDLLLVLGNAIISKKIKAYLRKAKLKTVWRVDEAVFNLDTFDRLDRGIQANATDFVKGLSETLGRFEFANSQSFGKLWFDKFESSRIVHDQYLNTLEFSDFSVIRDVLHAIPEGSYLHLGNSSVARYAQLFELKHFRAVHCNRGTSGIDGSVSTAAGAASADLTQMHTLIVGDISFLYDSNALWNSYLTENFRIIVIHNGGGGIFEIIPGPDSSEFSAEFFVAKQRYKAEHLCKAFDVHYCAVYNETELNEILHSFFNNSANGRPKLLEVFTQNRDNAAKLKGYFSAMNALR